MFDRCSLSVFVHLCVLQDTVPRMAEALHNMRDDGNLNVNAKDKLKLKNFVIPNNTNTEATTNDQGPDTIGKENY